MIRRGMASSSCARERISWRDTASPSARPPRLGPLDKLGRRRLSTGRGNAAYPPVEPTLRARRPLRLHGCCAAPRGARPVARPRRPDLPRARDVPVRGLPAGGPYHPAAAFKALNDSLAFDVRLWPYDIAQSRAHAGMLAAQGIISEEDRDRLLDGLERVAAELRTGSFAFAPSDEDIHMAIERRLTELVGPVGGRLHTARSRNDQVATDVAMFVRERAAAAADGARRLGRTLLSLAEAHLDWPMPAYTHLQRAQPVYLSHHLLAYVWMLVRDRSRFGAVVEAAGALPLGAGALAGVNFDTDRERVARELGFERLAENSLDAVSNRDFVLDYLAAAATCATHLSRLGGEIVLWSSQEFGFCRLPDAWSSGSSIMPQKKNPDAAELLRAKAPRLAAHLIALHGVLHGLPLAYNKDMQED